MNFQILCFIKILQPPLSWQNLDRTIAYTRFHRIKGGSGVRAFPLPHYFDRVDEILNFYKSCSLSRWEQDSYNFINSFCVTIKFTLRHNVLCFSFVVVLYSMYGLYAINKVVFLHERDCHV